jgi:Mor family transcriptional regulator
MTSFIPTEDDDYPELLTDIAEQVAIALKPHLPAEAEAKRIGFEVAEHIRHHHAGEMIYFPRGRRFEANRLHEEIWQKFTGRNQPELAKEFKMTEPSIYRILKFMQLRASRKNQLSLLEGT